MLPIAVNLESALFKVASCLLGDFFPVIQSSNPMIHPSSVYKRGDKDHEMYSRELPLPESEDTIAPHPNYLPTERESL